MASTSQSIRFSGPGTGSGAGNLDALNRVLADLCTRTNYPKDGAALALKKHVDEEARDLSGEAFFRFMDQLYDRITSLLESNDVAENLGALRAIDELTDLSLGENSSKVSRFSNYMRSVFEVKRDRDILILASQVLGHLARFGGAMTADEVEWQVKNALEWLHGERVEYRRFAAVLILKEMAENASTVFNVHVPEFVDAIWVALRDPTLAVREQAVEALRACLRVIEKRETRWRVQWYYRMFEATQDGLGRNAPIHSIHGSLLAVGELLRLLICLMLCYMDSGMGVGCGNTGEFMMSRYREVAEIVLRYLEHRDRLVRLSITSLLPRIAHFLRDRFVTNYLAICMDHFFAVLKTPAERASGFVALGEMAGALDGELVHYLPTITAHLRDAIAPRRGKPSLEALSCVGSIAKAMGSAMEPHVRGLLDAMFSAGLSTTLVEALEKITVSTPSLLPSIQDQLLDCILGVLSKSYAQARPPVVAQNRGNVTNTLQQVAELSGSSLVQLSLQTLACFNFKGHDLLESARDIVVVYLEDEDGAIRKDAALCCCVLVANSFSGMACARFRSSRTGGKRQRLVEELENDVVVPTELICANYTMKRLFIVSSIPQIVEKLLITAVADADVTVRHSIFSSLRENGGFDDFLAQADSLSAIFAALNDEDFEVREYAISVTGRLSEKNPAYVLPALRRHLIQLLTYLKQSVDSKCREESAKLLGCLIRSCERLILPYIAPIHKALVAKLCEGTGVNANHGIISGVLVTVGDLARVGGFAMRQYIPELMPLIVEALLDGAAATKREVAVATLGQVVQSTGYVITPYNEYPLLLGLLLKLLNGELAWSTRREVLKVLGIMGALDPHLHKRNQQRLSGSHGEVTHAASDSGQHIQSMDELPMDLWPSFATSEDYFSTVAINSLVRILRDASLSSYHQKVVGSLMFIFKISQWVLAVSHTCQSTCDDGLKEYITWKLGTLVSIVRQHIRKYLPELLSLIAELWSSFSLPAANRPVHGSAILHLLEQLCLALNDEFRKHLPVILPCCIQVLSDAERFNDYTYVLDILHTLEVFGGTLDEHMHLLLPALIRLFNVDASVDIRRAAIKTLTRLIPRVQVIGHISALVRHLKLVLDGSYGILVNLSLYIHVYRHTCTFFKFLGSDVEVNIFKDIVATLYSVVELLCNKKFLLDFQGLHINRKFVGILGASETERVCSDVRGDGKIPMGEKVGVASGHGDGGSKKGCMGLVQGSSIVNGKSDGLRKDAVDALCCLAHALGEDFTIFIPSIHKLLLKHRLRHKEFEEIEGRLQRREPLILGCPAAERFNRHLAVEVISDPLNDVENDPYDDGIGVHRQHKIHKVNDVRLRSAGEASQRSTKEDWAEWMRHFSIELLKESPSPALRTCARLAQLQPFVGRELFAAGFVSCWSQLSETIQKQLVRSLEMAFSSPNIPPEILATLLNLAEFMEHDEKPLPIDIRLLGALADKCRAFAKALHYKEMEFEGARSKKMDANPAAVGILTYAQQHLDVQLKESCSHYSRYEKLQRWDDALKAYTAKASQSLSPHLVLDATLVPYEYWVLTGCGYGYRYGKRRSSTFGSFGYDMGTAQVRYGYAVGRIRCLAALARWEELNNLCKEFWTSAEPAAQLEMAPLAASAAWNMGEWDQMAEYVSRLDDGDETKLRVLGNTSATGDGSSNGAFFRAVLLVRKGKYGEARKFVERARECLATELAALVLESYDRAYSNMVRVQQLSELEEVIDYCTLPVGNTVAEGRRALIRNMWNERIQGAKRNVEVWQALLAVRALVLPPKEDIDTWIKFASLCQKSGRISQAKSTLIKLLRFDPETCLENIRYHGPPQVMLAYLKYQWSLGEDHKRREAFAKLQDLAIEISTSPNIEPVTSTGLLEILNAFRNATHYASKWAEAWHSWALFNTAVMSIYTVRGFPTIAAQFVVAAVTGYFHSIACAANAKGVDDSLQDILRLLTLWFNHGATAEVQMALQKGFEHVNINTWLAVLPQIIARIHSNNHAVRELIQSLLVRIGQSHPQVVVDGKRVCGEFRLGIDSRIGVLKDTWILSREVIVGQSISFSGWSVAYCRGIPCSRLLNGRPMLLHAQPYALMYPLLVACKSISNTRKAAAQEVVDKVRQHSGVLVDQAQLVSNELIRVAILWHEMWHEALEEASRLYFGEHNIEGMLKVLEPLHEVLEEGAMRNNTTMKEKAFIQAYHHELLEAYECCMKYKKTGKDAELTQSVSPELVECQNLELAVPGTYRADSPLVTIASFAPELVIITSKQRPRKLTIHGSDGEDYAFLLKGHEDLRQDERVMQLFGLVNTLLENSRNTAEKDLSIQRYAVIPLSPNSGLIGWVPNCDTLHQLIREYRDARKITLNLEHKHMLNFAQDYDHLPLIAKVEVFEYALQNTEGNDLARVLWLKSRTSENWLDRRTNYTRSLAVMSMVGYLLGLGDRHPSNIMLHRYSGKILHIDFGDCFEASMNREKFPEKVPFRLTRMLVKAMEVSGIEGNFRSTCENVMQVLRANKDSVMAMMEAFVHDPLINWRLFNCNEVPQISTIVGAHVPPVVNSEEIAPNGELLQPQRGAREREQLQAVNQLGDANGVLIERAVVVMARMSNKLTGRDFSTSSSVSTNSIYHAVDHDTLISGDTREVEHGLSVKLQVQKLILQASSHENLCQNYVGAFVSEMAFELIPRLITYILNGVHVKAEIA
ncbi:hypothetical protein TEA_016039 [Camellia sinensis var. sinensis]|uniref:Serine/threonine-protein kinase TOR n=1 Tax=Camellia sinensis var. sinensis TaxID=542762 RepID=A0A4S4EMI6_CAMSN|nr:hypothetical protein TEA_016039 [Camellia sinensis var. sinensis]